MNIRSNKIEICINKDPLLIQLKTKLKVFVLKTSYNSKQK